MNTNLVSEYLQILRKNHNYTQDELAKELGLTRQAVSKWETGTAIPDIEVLLKLSKLYGITINNILEPDVQPQKISDFEQILTIPEKELKEALKQVDTVTLTTALMGASPEINSLVEKIFPNTNYEMIRMQIGRVKIETVEDMQKQIISIINLKAINRESIDI